MLRRTASIAALSLVLMLPIEPAVAAGEVTCPVDLPNCIVTIDNPGSAGGTSGGTGSQTGSNGGGRVCWLPFRDEVVDCYDESWGWFSSVDSCYYRLRDPQPPATDPI